MVAGQSPTNPVWVDLHHWFIWRGLITSRHDRLPALKAAVDNGADCIYLGFRDATNARNFAGLNFDEAAISTGVMLCA